MSQPPLGSIFGRPRVGEIQKNPFRLLWGEDLVQLGGVPVEKKQVGQIFFDGSLHGQQQGAGVPFHSYEIDLGIFPSHLEGKAAFATADFQPKRRRAAETTAPLAPQSLGFCDMDGLALGRPGF